MVGRRNGTYPSWVVPQTRLSQYGDAICATWIAYGGLVALAARNEWICILVTAEVPISHPSNGIAPTGGNRSMLSRLRWLGMELARTLEEGCGAAGVLDLGPTWIDCERLDVWTWGR